MKPILRIATPEDAPLIREVYAHYIRQTEATFNELLKPLESFAADIEKLLETYPYLIAEDETGRFLGFANAEPMRPQSGYRFSVELTIYLHPASPVHTGIGKALYQALLPMLRRQHFVNAYSVINSVNEDSIALHRLFGFEPLFTQENCAYKHGKWLSALWMHKQLNEIQNPPLGIIPFSAYRQELTLDEKGRLV